MASLGDTLRKRRIALGKTLADAEAATRIRARLLDALEDGEYDRLPNPAYVRGYITSYARWLEIDPAPLLTMYRAESGAVGPTSAIPRREPVVVPRDKAHAVPWRAAVIIAVVLLAIVLAFWGARSLKRGQTATPLPTQPQTTETAVSPGATGTAAPSPGSGESSTSTVQPGEPLSTVPFTLRVAVADGASWARITVDGKKAYEGTLVSGQSKEYVVTDVAVVRIGRPSVVKVYRNAAEVAVPDSQNTPTLTLKAEKK